MDCLYLYYSVISDDDIIISSIQIASPNAIFHFHTMGSGAALNSSWPIPSRELDEVFSSSSQEKGSKLQKLVQLLHFFDKKSFDEKPCTRIIIRQWLK